MSQEKKQVATIKLKVIPGSAVPGGAISAPLGQKGVPAKIFCEKFNDITKPLHYGIDFTHFFSDTFEKVPYSFIYSSFPNRGLIVVLKMWPRIARAWML